MEKKVYGLSHFFVKWWVPNEPQMSTESTKAPVDEVRRLDGAVSQKAQEIHGIHMELLAETARGS